jgi:adenylate cyclase
VNGRFQSGKKTAARGRRSPIPVIPGLAVTLVVLVLQALQPGILVEARNLLFDLYQRLAPRPFAAAPVAVVNIDDDSLARLGQWPWPRTDIARLTQTLADSGAAAIAFDIVFSERDRTSPAAIAAILRKDPNARGSYDDIAALPDHDVLLGETFAHLPVINGYLLTRGSPTRAPPPKAGIAVSGVDPLSVLPRFDGAIAPITPIDTAPGRGFFSTVTDSDGIIRTAPLLARVGDTIEPALSIEALRVAQQAGAILVKTTSGSGQFSVGQAGIVEIKIGSFAIRTTRSGGLWMYWREPRPDDSIPAWKIMTGTLAPAQLKAEFAGKIVFVGAGAETLGDLVATPVAKRELGVEVHAQAVEQMILGKFLVRPDWAMGLERSVIVLLGIALALGLPGLGALRGGLIGAAALLVGVEGSWFAFHAYGFMLDPIYPALVVVGVYTASTLYSFWREERQRAYIHRAFDRYLSPELVQRIARDPGQLELGGEERDMTVMFCDIRGFSHISEKLSPQEIIAFLIEFLTPASDVLTGHKATIDKFIGDAILAFWNAPLDDPDHAKNAALGALALRDKVVELNSTLPHQTGKTWPGEVHIGIGLDSGPCCVGNVGSKQRLSYSLIGDTVNLASRIEGLTKVYGVAIAMGEGLSRRLPDFAQLEIDKVRVVGRDTPEPISTLIGDPLLAADTTFRELADLQREFLVRYRAQDWNAAENLLQKLKKPASSFGLDRLLLVYAARIRNFRASPPPVDWDGVFVAEHK